MGNTSNGRCRRGHVLAEVGRYAHGGCIACAKDKAKRAAGDIRIAKLPRYTPDPKDPAVQRCRAERERVLKERAEHGEEWWRQVA